VGFLMPTLIFDHEIPRSRTGMFIMQLAESQQEIRTVRDREKA